MLKLEDLKTLEIEKLNEIVGGDNWMGLDKDDYETLKCYGNCGGFIYPDGSYTQSGDSMTLD